MTKNKKAALELSMTTIVVLVLAMSMLILGLVLVKTIFSGAKYNVEQMNQKVEDEIGKLFTEDKKIVVYLANNLAEITQGDNWGVAFGIKNQVSSSKIGTSNRDCVKESEAMSWIRLGKEGSITLAPGQDKVWLVRFEIPETAPLCLIRYNIEIKADGTFYTSESFDVSIEA
jgi:hypothetical protein